MPQLSNLSWMFSFFSSMMIFFVVFFLILFTNTFSSIYKDSLDNFSFYYKSMM